MSQYQQQNHRHALNTQTYGKGCRGKVAYASRKQANGMRRVIVRKGKAYDPDQFWAYKCRACHKWHLGHSYTRDVMITEESYDE